MLKINNISKKYNNYNILNCITLEVKKKEIVGLIGLSGSGKTTLMRCIQKLTQIDSGNIICDGEVGFIFQDFQLFPHMKVWDNIIYAPNIKGTNKGSKQEIKQNISDILKKLNIYNIIDRYPHELSGGQKQRVALARSLIIKPSLLLCDEPTSGLDVISINKVISLLKSIQDNNVAMIISSHDLSFLTKISERIIVLNKGTIVAEIKNDKFHDAENIFKSAVEH